MFTSSELKTMNLEYGRNEATIYMDSTIHLKPEAPFQISLVKLFIYLYKEVSNQQATYKQPIQINLVKLYIFLLNIIRFLQRICRVHIIGSCNNETKPI